jgi:hypothetical protein
MAQVNPFTSAQAQSWMAPELAAQQTELSRQQQIAQMLQQQAQQPDGNTEMVSGIAIRKSPWEHVSKLVNAGLGAYMQNKNDEKQLEISKGLQDQKAQGLAAILGGGGQPSNQAPAASFGPPQLGQDSMPEVPRQAPQSQYADGVKRAAMAAYMQGNQELGNKLAAQLYQQSPEALRAQELGQPLEQQKAYANALQRKSMTEQISGGNYSRDFGSGETAYFPKLGEGMVRNQDGSISAASGYSGANAGIKGAEAGAVEAAKAGYGIEKLDTPTGPVANTRLNFVNQMNATGGGGVAANNQGTIAQAPNGTSFNFQGMGPAEVRNQFMRIKDPAQRQSALADFDASQGRQAVPGQAKPSGMQLETPESNALKLQRTKDMGETAKNYESIGEQGRGMRQDLSALNSYLSDPNLASGRFAGAINTGKNILNSVGIEQKGLASAEGAKAIINKLTLGSKGGMTGSMTDRDVEFLQGMVPQLGQSPAGQREVMGYLQKAADRQVQVSDMARAYEQAYGKIDNGFRDQLKAFSDANPLFPQATKPAIKTEFDAMPNPKDFTGKKMRAPDGTIIQSNGSSWVKVK